VTAVIKSTAGFERDCARLSAGLEQLAQSEVRQLIARINADPKTWRHGYDRVEDVQRYVIELELGSGCRLLADVSRRSEVTLLAVGRHEIVKRLRDKNIEARLAKRRDLSPAFLPNGGRALFPDDEGDELAVYGNEASPEWIYFLDDEQERICGAIEEAIFDAAASSRSSRHIVLGGPGTGKTSIIVKLLKEFVDMEAPVELACTTPVARYLEKCLQWQLEPYRTADRDAVLIRLVDDPVSMDAIRNHFEDSASLAGIVIAFDPLQLSQSVTDDEYQSILREQDVTEYRLGTCYRQKEKVGRAAMRFADAIANSSPFLAAEKKATFRRQHRDLTTVANGVTFVNPTGVVKTIESADFGQWDRHLKWIARQHGLWQHYPSVLLVQDDDIEVPSQFRPMLKKLRITNVRMSRLEKIKGLEFQHAIILIGRRRYELLCNGFEGSGKKEYREYRLLRIPFTRAKDSFATFVLD
jgi:GTPase SAR1 family protein